MRLKILVVALMFSKFCFAQNTIPKNELGLNLYGNEYEFGNLKISPGVKHYTLSGFQYKRNLNNKYLLRLLLNYKNEAYNDNGEDWLFEGGWLYSSGMIKTQDYKIGIEKVFSQKKIKPFVFIDLGYRYFNNKGIDTWINNNSSSSGHYSYDLTHYYLNANVGFGLKYYPTNHIYLSAETNIGFHREIFDGAINPTFVQFVNPINTFVFGVRF